VTALPAVDHENYCCRHAENDADDDDDDYVSVLIGRQSQAGRGASVSHFAVHRCDGEICPVGVDAGRDEGSAAATQTADWVRSCCHC